LSHRRHCALAGHGVAATAAVAATRRAKKFGPPIAPLYEREAKTGLIAR
jgi:hypothetical protein